MPSSLACMRNYASWAGSAGTRWVVIVGDGAEWIWNRASMLCARCEILDFWHALEHAWEVARLLYGEQSHWAGRWVHQIAEDLRAGKVEDVIARLKRMRPKTPELREKLQGLIAYYSEHAGRMRLRRVSTSGLWDWQWRPWRARTSRWCMPASVRQACAGVRRGAAAVGTTTAVAE